jgi:hypothetical protein
MQQPGWLYRSGLHGQIQEVLCRNQPNQLANRET